jgi:exo-beta-1,3-glucanase (GH17 family)
MLDSTKSSDEKPSFEEVGFPTTGRTGASASAANVTRFISEKLSDWGVEERGACRIFSFQGRSTLE